MYPILNYKSEKEPGQEEDEVRQIADYDADDYGGLDYGPQDASKAGT